MKQPLNDNTKAKLKAICRTASDQIRVAGPPVLRWMQNHKALVVIILLVLYILWPRSSTPQLKGPAITATGASNDSNSPTTGRPTSRPTTQPITTQYAGEIPLYAPGVEGAEPQWSLPSELSKADIQNFIKQVDTLADNYNLATNLENRYDEIVSTMMDDKIFACYWSRVKGRGFQDTNLPLDWYQLVKDQPVGLIEKTLAMPEALVRQTIVQVVMTRLRTTQMRLVGGKLLIGDELFVKSLRSYVDGRLSRFKTLTPLAESVDARQAKEFR